MKRLAYGLRRLRVAGGWLVVVMWVAMLVSWVVSFWMPHGYYVTGLRRYGIWCDGGIVQFRYGVKSDLDFTNPGRWKIREVGYGGERGPGTWAGRGVRVVLAQWPPFQEAEFASGGEAPTIDGRTEFFGERIRIWGVAHWLGLGVLCVPVMWIVFRAWRSRITNRIAKGLCARCGYDLRASPERCPECGAVRSGLRDAGSRAL